MTENFGYSHFSRADRRRPGFVGECLPQAQARLNDDGEVLMQSPSLMLGYYLQPELTQEVLREGWLYSGDLGEIDELGRLRITGRKKDLFKTSKGKYVAPGPIETRLEMAAGVAQLVVIGAGLAQPVALAVVPPAADADREQLSTRLAGALQQINADLDAHEKLAAIIVSTQVWTTDNGLLTPSLKPRRFEIEQLYLPKISALLAALPDHSAGSSILFLE